MVKVYYNEDIKENVLAGKKWRLSDTVHKAMRMR